MPVQDKICLHCQGVFQPRRPDQTYCTRAHKDRAHSARQKELQKTYTVQCRHPGCELVARRDTKTLGYCPMHTRRWRSGEDLDRPSQRTPRGVHRPCSVSRCPRRYYANGLCSLHYNRRATTGDVGPVEVKRRSNGTVWIDPESGYAYQYGRLQHRVVMEQLLGRKLLRRETVHHKNGHRADNRPENLELWVKTHPSGQRVHDLVAFVVEHYSLAVRAALKGKPLQLRLFQ